DRDAMVERLLREPGIETVFDKQDMHEKSPLHYAAESGCVDLTEQLVKRGADVSLVDEDERRAAHVAAKRGHLGCLRLLIAASGAIDRSIGQRDLDESTTLLLAAEEGRFEVFRYLCDSGADFNAKDEIGRNALMLAVSKSHYDIAKFLLDLDIDVSATDVSK
uniref:ANK_REP_REGION domain-containing protein n=1 Tax=Macrostomum lignano TaxID=282301 RepID=A0A1I8J2I3_9PLAT